MRYSALALLFFLIVPAAGAGVPDAYVVRCKQFMQDNPVILANADEMGLVGMWQEIDGLKGCVDLWRANKSVFSRPGQGELRPWMIHKRLNGYVRHVGFPHDDPLVSSLQTLIRLHTSVAEGFMDGRVNDSTYLAVASSTSTAGRYLAEQIEAKYGKGRRVIKRSKPAPW